MKIQSRLIDYSHNGVELQAYMSWDDEIKGARPGVLVCHNWAGRSENDARNADKLAQQGYVGFALDLYGKGILGSSREENAPRMQALLDDRPLLQDRLKTALDLMQAQEEVDEARCAVIGYCFGGLCALDMARSGAEIKAAVSFHGLFHPAKNIADPQIRAKILILHGWDDPMATPQDVLTVSEELTRAKADWQLHAYGGTMHAFTAPAANDPANGTVYSAVADRRSWQAACQLLEESLG